ncbi:hypothetical protein GCM10020221_24680 [Streptomyces thioluteus]|uniref:Uncharacterized protein n=1 Tax=Streptomyces thioluteus TaxID=66431 RepID=A0ABN3WTS9_STRTU
MSGAAGQHEQSDVLVVTTNDVPGYRARARHRLRSSASTVRSRHVGSQIGAGLKSLIGAREL